MSHHPPANDILTVNPYESHPSLSPLEAAALWEYAKLAHNVRMVRPLLCCCSNERSRYIPLGVHTGHAEDASAQRGAG